MHVPKETAIAIVSKYAFVAKSLVNMYVCEAFFICVIFDPNLTPIHSKGGMFMRAFGNLYL
jgi:hypothetical protein